MRSSVDSDVAVECPMLKRPKTSEAASVSSARCDIDDAEMEYASPAKMVDGLHSIRSPNVSLAHKIGALFHVERLIGVYSK